MKRCPTCETLVFDDMPRCYECMHYFEDELRSAVDQLADHFVVDLLGLVIQPLLNGEISIEELAALFRERGAVGAVAQEQLDP